MHSFLVFLLTIVVVGKPVAQEEGLIDDSSFQVSPEFSPVYFDPNSNLGSTSLFIPGEGAEGGGGEGLALNNGPIVAEQPIRNEPTNELPLVDESNDLFLLADADCSSSTNNLLGKRQFCAPKNDFQLPTIPTVDQTKRRKPSETLSPLGRELLNMLLGSPASKCPPERPYDLCCICSFSFTVCQQCFVSESLECNYDVHVRVCCQIFGLYTNLESGKTNLEIWSDRYLGWIDSDLNNQVGTIAEDCAPVNPIEH